MKAIVTSASEINQDGTQYVAFDVMEGDELLISHTIQVDVDQAEDEVKSFLQAYKQKVNSDKRVEVGDSWEI